MCGITGFFNIEGAEQKAKEAINRINYRGKDGNGFVSNGNCALGHCLHAINSIVKQPLEDSDCVLVANCEIYNWKEIDRANKANSRNDSEALFRHLASNITAAGIMIESLKALDGVYAFGLWNTKKRTIIIARDIIGEKPIWYYYEPISGGFAFASERKALISQRLEKAYIRELNPRVAIEYDVAERTIKEYQREFFRIKKIDGSDEEIIRKTGMLIEDAIRKRISKENKVGILFSGGIDSTFIALILKKMGIQFTCYTAGLKEDGLKESEDIIWSRKAAKELGLDIAITEIKLSEVAGYLQKILPLIEDNNVVKAGISLPLFIAAEQAKKDGVRILFSGNGSDELFAGYERHKNSLNINEECLSSLRKIYERDLYKDDVTAMYHTIELRSPYLDVKLVDYALSIPSLLKIGSANNKIVLRKVAEASGLKKEFAERKKKAAQYGSNFDKAIEKLARREKKTKSEYLRQFYDEGNAKIGVLLSTGKDSILAAQIMMEQNYDVSCFITIISENEDSYMYHGPNTSLAKLQAESAGKPIIIRTTIGEKEKELSDLKGAISEAMRKYKIEGIATGALFSNYQRQRIEKICEELGIKCYSPLWHMDQEKELAMLLQKGIEFIIVKVAAEGLDEKWLGKEMTEQKINELIKTSRKHGINPAGEGGEYESLVLDASFFKKRLNIMDSTVQKDGDSYTLKITEAELSDKKASP